MNLHKFKEDFQILISIVAKEKHIPESAIKRDYYIVLLLYNLSSSQFSSKCIFKGGTSLSKCYPGSIERFSEDIDLTYLGKGLNDKECSKILKEIEKTIVKDCYFQKINGERTKRSKSCFVWIDDEKDKIKLEIGSSVIPNPIVSKTVKSYIHEYLEHIGDFKSIKRFELEEVNLQIQSIERTFIDKVMAIKRHTLCGTIERKVRHIYDVFRLFKLKEIQVVLKNKQQLKQVVTMTKQSDSLYFEKRNTRPDYNIKAPYSFETWKNKLNNKNVSRQYGQLHKTFLYTDEKQNLEDSIKTLTEIDLILKEIGE